MRFDECPGAHSNPPRCFPSLTGCPSFPSPPHLSMTSADEEVPEYSVLVAKLFPHERIWLDKQPFLEGRGYALRPRYCPDWKPSWENGPVTAERAEDGITLPARDSQIDATRIEDGKLVYIKRILSQSDELRIALLFSQEPQRDNEHNHAVSILDHFLDPQDARITYIVMPLLHSLDEPSFLYVSDAIDFVSQMLEGLAYMHALGVAHRDCTYQNIMMDATPLYPNGFHPVYTTLSPDASRTAEVISRREAQRPVKYFYIDFGISVLMPPGQARLVVGEQGLDRTVPELSDAVPYDPFKVDVFILGNLFQKQILDRYSNVELLRPLVARMLRAEPSARPDAASVLEHWYALRRRIRWLQREWRLRRRSETRTKAVVADAAYLFNFGMHLLRRLHW